MSGMLSLLHSPSVLSKDKEYYVYYPLLYSVQFADSQLSS